MPNPAFAPNNASRCTSDENARENSTSRSTASGGAAGGATPGSSAPVASRTGSVAREMSNAAAASTLMCAG
jgi:hypothetical protein